MTATGALVDLVAITTTHRLHHDGVTDEMSVKYVGEPPSFCHSKNDRRIPNFLETVKSCLNRKVSDRKIHEEQLLQSYRRLKDRKKSEFVLISGPNGSGKTHLAKTLRHAVQDDGGIFLIGKFDQLQRPEPYRACVIAFTEFATMIEQEGQDRLARLQHSILEAVGEGADALTEMIPALKRVIGHQDRTSSLKNGAEAMDRFVLVFRMFMRAICSPENPLVFVLDDMHWADPCSLDLLTSLVTDTESKGVLFVGTCEDNVAMDSPLSAMLRKLEDEENVQITNVVACNLSHEEVKQIVEEALCMRKDHFCAKLADVIYTQTEGNVCYIIEFFRWLLEEKLLEFNQDSLRWEWRQEEISLSIKHDRVGDFMIDKLEQLSDPVQELLKIASCIGSVVNEDLLRFVVDFELTPALEKSMERGMLVYDDKHRSYAFTHDVAQKAAYALIKPEDRSHFHRSIGRKLWRRIEERDLNYHVFTIVSQYCFSGNVIEDQTEMVAIASLCLHAGRKAAKSSTFRTASTYLNFGIRLLGANGWKEHYSLELDLHNAAAEMELCITNFDRMNALLDAVFENVRHPPDKRQAYATRIYALGVTDQQQEALQTGKIVLRELGEKFPARFMKAHLLAEMMIIKRLLRRKSDEMLMRLPLMEDSKMLAAIQILDLMFVNALVAAPALLPFVVLKMIKITVQHGSSAWTATAFSSFGMVCCAVDDFDQGFRFGQLALAYLEKFQCREFLPRVYFGVYGKL
jgi:predicted ATPase